MLNTDLKIKLNYRRRTLTELQIAESCQRDVLQFISIETDVMFLEKSNDR